MAVAVTCSIMDHLYFKHPLVIIYKVYRNITKILFIFSDIECILQNNLTYYHYFM
jgi:hypothetical protein